MFKSLSRCLLFVTSIVCLLVIPARGQSLARVGQDSWNQKDFFFSYDNPIFQMGGHVANSDYTSRVQWWDSNGRVRLNVKDQDSPFVAYRILTSDVNTHSPLIHATMDEFDVAAGLHLGSLDGWKISTLLGAGYSGTHPLVNEKGVFGIGDITAERPISEHDSILLAVDYGGANSLLPDVPLPGFAYLHHDDHLDLMLGFPVNRVSWRPIPNLAITVQYQVPYTGSANIEYVPWEHFGFYASTSNFFQGIVIAKENTINRQFFQMRRVEAGVRFIFSPLVDAGVGIGYAFDQTISQGFDIRSLRAVTRISNEPYLSIVLHGRF